MAVTAIWKVEKRLDHTLDYIMNIEKTKNEDYGKSSYLELHKLKEYEDIDYKNEMDCYVSGINCVADYAYNDMMQTKMQYDKTDGILGFHAFQSFKEGEVTPDMAHLIGIKLAEEMWGDRFEVVVATHQNTNHIHNHFIINSVSFKDGKKYSDNRESYARLRHLSDSICQEYGLSVIEEKKLNSGINYDNYYKGYVTKSNYHTLAKQDLDRAIAMAYSLKDFENIMKKMGYEIINRYGKYSIRREPYKKNIRIERNFGSEYSIAEIEKQIENTTATRVPFLDAYNPIKKVRVYEKAKKQKSKGLYGLYKYYCYILKVYPRHYPRRIMSPALRVEVQKMDEISKQTRLLVSKEIKTYEQLLFYRNELVSNIEKLEERRNYLWIKIKRVASNEEKQKIRNEIDLISQELNTKKKEVVLCDGIKDRSKAVEKNIEEFEEEKGKERENEFK